MANTGTLIVVTLEEYYTDDGSLTGNTKANTPGDPDYVAPYTDLVACPLPVTYQSAPIVQNVTRNNCGSGFTGETKSYTIPLGSFRSQVSQADADNKAQSHFNTHAQNIINGTTNAVDAPFEFGINANTAGTCTVDPQETLTVDMEYVVGSGLQITFTSSTSDHDGIIFSWTLYRDGSEIEEDIGGLIPADGFTATFTRSADFPGEYRVTIDSVTNPNFDFSDTATVIVE